MNPDDYLISFLPQDFFQKIEADKINRQLFPAFSDRAAWEALKTQPSKRTVIRELLEDAAERDAEGRVVEKLLSSEAGRTYLLFDAAAGDLA